MKNKMPSSPNASIGDPGCKRLFESMFQTWIPAFAGMTIVVFVVSSFLYAAPYAYPVPYVAKQHQDIVFKELPFPSTVRVVTVSGEEVIKLEGGSDNKATWNVKNSAGKQVASGVYYYLIDASGQQTIGKLVIIR